MNRCPAVKGPVRKLALTQPDPHVIVRDVPLLLMMSTVTSSPSLAIVGADVEAEDWAERAARDVALWDQLGCLSTAAVYAVGDRTRVEAVARALAEALRSLEARWPRGRIGAGVEAAIRDARDEARFRAAAGQEVALMAPSA